MQYVSPVVVVVVVLLVGLFVYVLCLSLSVRGGRVVLCVVSLRAFLAVSLPVNVVFCFLFCMWPLIGSLAPLDGALSPWGLVFFLLLSARL